MFPLILRWQNVFAFRIAFRFSPLFLVFMEKVLVTYLFTSSGPYVSDVLFILGLPVFRKLDAHVNIPEKNSNSNLSNSFLSSSSLIFLKPIS